MTPTEFQAMLVQAMGQLNSSIDALPAEPMTTPTRARRGKVGAATAGGLTYTQGATPKATPTNIRYSIRKGAYQPPPRAGKAQPAIPGYYISKLFVFLDGHVEQDRFKPLGKFLTDAQYNAVRGQAIES